MITTAYIFIHRFKGMRRGDAARLTHVNLSFALIKDGKGSIEHWPDLHGAREFIKNRGHLKAMLTVGGWGAGGFSPAVATPESRETFAQSLMDIVDDYGFDGIDVNWEYPCDDVAGIEASPADKPNFTALIQLLREKLGKDRLLSIAVGASQRCASNLEIPKLAELVDFVNIMTYDMCPSNYVSHHTSIYPSHTTRNPNCDDAVRLYEAAGIPKDKLVIGAAFYARGYRDVDGLDAPAAAAPGFSEGGYATTLKLVEAAGGLRYDHRAEAPYAYDAMARTFITFDNPRSLQAKVAYIKSTGLGGIMFWEYASDTEDSALLKAIAG